MYFLNIKGERMIVSFELYHYKFDMLYRKFVKAYDIFTIPLYSEFVIH